MAALAAAAARPVLWRGWRGIVAGRQRRVATAGTRPLPMTGQPERVCGYGRTRISAMLQELRLSWAGSSSSSSSSDWVGSTSQQQGDGQRVKRRAGVFCSGNRQLRAQRVKATGYGETACRSAMVKAKARNPPAGSGRAGCWEGQREGHGGLGVSASLSLSPQRPMPARADSSLRGFWDASDATGLLGQGPSAH